MSLPGDSILVTPGSGATIATESVSAKEYEVWMDSDANGHIEGGIGYYVGSQDGNIFPTGDHKLCALWNGVGSGVTIEVLQYNVYMGDAIGDDFNTKNMPRMYRLTSAPSAGTTRTPAETKSTLATLPAQVLFYGEGVTATVTGQALSFGLVWQASNSFGAISPFGKMALCHDVRDGEPLILTEGEGVVVHGGDNNNVAAAGGQALYFLTR